MHSTVDELGRRLRDNPADFNAFSDLRAHYQEAEDYFSLANLLEGWAARWQENEAAAAAFYEAGELCLGPLADPGRAVDMYQQALARHPLHLDASLRLENIFQTHNDLRRLAELLEHRAEALVAIQAEPSDVAQVHHQLGELWEQQASDEERALTHYTRAFEIDRFAVASIYAARCIQQQRGALEEVSALYTRERAAEGNLERRIALLREHTYLLLHGIGDIDLAIDTLRAGVEGNPDQYELVLDLADALLLRASQTPEANQSDLSEAAECFVIVATRCTATDEARSYLEAALDAYPGHDEALKRLTQLQSRPDFLKNRWAEYLKAAPKGALAPTAGVGLGRERIREGRLDDAIEVLEPLLESGNAEIADLLGECYQRLGRDDELLEVLAVAAEQDGQGTPVRSHELIGLLQERGNHGRALEVAKRVLARFPDDPIAFQLVEEDCRLNANFRGLRDVLFTSATHGHLSKTEQKARLVEVARLSLDHLDESAAALSAWQHIVHADPADSDARQVIERLLEECSKWDELAQTLEHEAEQERDAGKQASLFQRLGQIHRQQRGDLREAIRTQQRARELLPNSATVREELCSLLLEAGRQPEAVPLLRHQIAEAPRDQRHELLQQLADLLEQLNDQNGAAEVYGEILSLDPNDLPALEGLERIHRETGHWDQLVESLSYRSELLESEERSKVLSEMGLLCEEHLGQLERAGEYYWKAFDLDRQHFEALDRLTDNYENRGRYRKLVELLKREAEAETGQVRVELFRRIARTLAGHVGNLEAAKEAWQKVLETQEDEEALRFLIGYNDGQSDPSEQVEWLGRLANMTASRTEARALTTEQVRLLKETDLDRAWKVAERLLEDDGPEEPAVLALCADVAEKTKHTTAQAQALRRLLQVVTDEKDRSVTEPGWSGTDIAKAARTLAGLYEHQVKDSDGERFALSLWSRFDKKSPLPRKRLMPLLDAADDFRELVNCLEELALLTPKGDERRVLMLRASEILRTQLQDPERAFSMLAKQVSDGDHVLEEPLRELAREHDLIEKLSWVYVSAAQAASNGDDEVALWKLATAVLEEDLKDPERALEAAMRGLACQLGDLDMRDLVDRLAAETGSWQRLENVYERLWKEESDTQHRHDLGVHYGTMVGEHAPGNAIDWLVRAGLAATKQDEAFDEAERIAAEDATLIRKVVAGYQQRGEQSDSLVVRINSRLRCAVLTKEKLNDEETAVEHLLAAAAEAVDHSEQLERVEQYALRLAGSNQRNPRPLEAMNEFYRSAAKRRTLQRKGHASELLGRAARLYDQQGDEASAFRLFQEAAILGFDSPDRFRDFVNFGRKTDRIDEVLGVLEQLVEDSVDRTAAVSLLSLEATLLDEDLNRPEEAAAAYKRILTLRPKHEQASRRTIELLQQLGKYEDLLVVLEQQVRRSENDGEKLPWLKTMAGTWEEKLQNKWEATEAWNRVLEIQPGDAEAMAALDRLKRASQRPPDDEDDGVAGLSGEAFATEETPLREEDTQCTDPEDMTFSDPTRLPKAFPS